MRRTALDASGQPGESTSAPRLDTRLALRPAEAAEALGVSERKLREMLPELPHVRSRGVVLFPVKALERWLDERVTEEPSRVDAAVSEILRGVKVGE